MRVYETDAMSAETRASYLGELLERALVVLSVGVEQRLSDLLRAVKPEHSLHHEEFKKLIKHAVERSGTIVKNCYSLYSLSESERAKRPVITQEELNLQWWRARLSYVERATKRPVQLEYVYREKGYFAIKGMFFDRQKLLDLQSDLLTLGYGTGVSMENQLRTNIKLTVSILGHDFTTMELEAILRDISKLC